MTDNEHLLTKAKQLDPAALKVLHQQYDGLVVRYIQLKVSNPCVVEDLCGDVFVRILEGLQRGGWRDSPKGWIMGITRHVVADHYRQQMWMPEVALQESLIADESSDPTFQAISSERKRRLMQAIHQLTEDQREVVILRFIQGVTIQNTACAIDKTPGAVKALQYRALRSLPSKLKAINNNSEYLE